MTTNQIRYWELLEKRRANQVSEAENIRHNRATEKQARGELTEKVRSNMQNEFLIAMQNAERERANRAQEQLTASSLAETRRSNLAKEGETQRHNLAGEKLGTTTLSETIRHNKAGEGVAYGNLQVSRDSIALQRDSLNESIRSHQANEEETHRSNVEREHETNRSNLEREAETHRHNVTTELTNIGISAWQELETTRHNKAQESIDSKNATSRRMSAEADLIRANNYKPTTTPQPTVVIYDHNGNPLGTWDNFGGGKIDGTETNPSTGRGGKGSSQTQLWFSD